MATYRGYRGLRREGIGAFTARTAVGWQASTAVGWQPTEVTGVTGVEEGRDCGTFKARTAVGWQPTEVTGV